MTDPVWVRFSSAEAVMARAIPKSATFTWPALVIMMLPGLMSRWTTPLWWAKPRAAATSAAMPAAVLAGGVPWVRRISDRLRPSMNSMTM